MSSEALGNAVPVAVAGTAEQMMMNGESLDMKASPAGPGPGPSGPGLNGTGGTPGPAGPGPHPVSVSGPASVPSQPGQRPSSSDSIDYNGAVVKPVPSQENVFNRLRKYNSAR